MISLASQRYITLNATIPGQGKLTENPKCAELFAEYTCRKEFLHEMNNLSPDYVTKKYEKEIGLC